ncbi:hypothetical protein J1N10_09455 [Carboxylicivirga sp. A043]|uniref:hypothetical protein n=1 Tax=Carboxylicivirga litoralis TaxID=2816963 RepID=UPI0021CB11F3|nr:hypothetical protein [Carboxylicivirga sp. A043]MCU4156205.1 hypothetical protein [Carboxylicivirga sp. A043]
MKKIPFILLIIVCIGCNKDTLSIYPEIRFRNFERYIGNDLDYFKEKNKKNLVQPKGKISYYSVETANGFYTIYPESRCPVSGSCIDDWGDSDNYIIGGVSGHFEYQESLKNGITRIKNIIRFNLNSPPSLIRFQKQLTSDYSYEFNSYELLFEKIITEEIKNYSLFWEESNYVYSIDYGNDNVTFSVRMNHNLNK